MAAVQQLVIQTIHRRGRRHSGLRDHADEHQNPLIAGKHTEIHVRGPHRQQQHELPTPQPPADTTGGQNTEILSRTTPIQTRSTFATTIFQPVRLRKLPLHNHSAPHPADHALPGPGGRALGPGLESSYP